MGHLLPEHTASVLSDFTVWGNEPPCAPVLLPTLSHVDASHSDTAQAETARCALASLREEKESLLSQMGEVEGRCQRQAKVIEELTAQAEARRHRRRSSGGGDPGFDQVRMGRGPPPLCDGGISVRRVPAGGVCVSVRMVPVGGDVCDGGMTGQMEPAGGVCVWWEGPLRSCREGCEYWGAPVRDFHRVGSRHTRSTSLRRMHKPCVDRAMALRATWRGVPLLRDSCIPPHVPPPPSPPLSPSSG